MRGFKPKMKVSLATSTWAPPTSPKLRTSANNFRFSIACKSCKANCQCTVFAHTPGGFRVQSRVWKQVHQLQSKGSLGILACKNSRPHQLNREDFSLFFWKMCFSASAIGEVSLDPNDSHCLSANCCPSRKKTHQFQSLKATNVAKFLGNYY